MDVQDQLIAQVINHNNLDTSSEDTLSRDEAAEPISSPLHHILQRTRFSPSQVKQVNAQQAHASQPPNN